MDRAEKVGLGVAVAGHVVLFGLLSVGFLATPNPDRLKQQPVEVSLVDTVALEQAAPEVSTEAPAQSAAPEQGPAEDAAPPAEAEPEPAPEPRPVPPAPAPRPQPAPEPKPQPEPQPQPQPKPRPKPAPPQPAPAARPQPAPKPVPQARPQPRPQPAAERAAPAKPAPARPAPAAQPKAAPARPAGGQPARTAPARPAATAGSGTNSASNRSRPTGRLDDVFKSGFGTDPTPSRAQTPPAARIGAQAAANIGSAILRQVQPCANRQVTPGPGAERIRVTMNLRINRDGSLAARPTVRGHDGVDDDNQRYVARVDDLAIATFVGCAPLRGLPPELYDVPGGWSNFTLRYKLPG